MSTPKLRLCLPLLLCLSVTFAKDSPKPAMLTAIQNAKTFVVPIVCYKQEQRGVGTLVSIEGTGFFISNDKRVVTAGHVARELYSRSRQKPCPLPAIYAPLEGWKRQSGATVPVRFITISECLYGNDLDIAICDLALDLKTDEQIKVKPKSGHLHLPLLADGTPIAFTGFPLSAVEPITSQGIVAMYGAYSNLGPTQLLIDKNAWPGASGSPVYNEAGNIVGMVNLRGTNEGTGLAYAIPAVVIDKFIKDNPPKK